MENVGVVVGVVVLVILSLVLLFLYCCLEAVRKENQERVAVDQPQTGQPRPAEIWQRTQAPHHQPPQVLQKLQPQPSPPSPLQQLQAQKFQAYIDRRACPPAKALQIDQPWPSLPAQGSRPSSSNKQLAPTPRIHRPQREPQKPQKLQKVLRDQSPYEPAIITIEDESSYTSPLKRSAVRKHLHPTCQNTKQAEEFSVERNKTDPTDVNTVFKVHEKDFSVTTLDGGEEVVKSTNRVRNWKCVKVHEEEFQVRLGTLPTHQGEEQERKHAIFHLSTGHFLAHESNLTSARSARQRSRSRHNNASQAAARSRSRHNKRVL